MAWPKTLAARIELARSHTMCARIDVLHGGRYVTTLVPVEGEMTAEAKRSITRNLAARITDPTGQLDAYGIQSLLAPASAELAPYRGVVIGGVRVEYPLGVFRMTGRERNGDGTVSLTAHDRGILYQGGMRSTLAIPAGTPVETAIRRLLLSRNSGLALQAWKTGYTVGPLIYQPDADVWAEAQKLAESVGGWLAHDRNGYLIFGASVPTKRTPEARYTWGDGLLLKASKSENFDAIHNMVIVRSATLAGGGIIEGSAADTNPLSPTFVGGSFGTRPVILSNQYVGSVQQAKQMAAAELVRELGHYETVTVECPVDPTRDPLDLLVINQPNIDLIERTVMVSNATIPLTAKGRQTMTCHRSLISADGRTIDLLGAKVTDT